MAKRIPTPLKSIRLKCVDCMGGIQKEIELCPIEDCSLYLYRFGKNPSRKGVGNKAPNGVKDIKR